MRTAHLSTLFYAFGVVLMTVWSLYVGREILLPIVTAVLVVYVMTAVTDALGRVPVVGSMPRMLRSILVGLGFVLIFVLLGVVVERTLTELQEVMPTYQANLEELVQKIPALDDVDASTMWQDLYRATIGRVDVQALIVSLLAGITSFGATAFLVTVYAAFLAAERSGFPAKIAAAFPDGEQARFTERIIAETNQRIGDYLAVKTLMNVITGLLSFVILWLMDVDFAVFYAVMLGFLNYIPYVGSIVGVILPVVLSLAQFGSIWTTTVLGVLLLLVQLFTDNVLEPNIMGKQLNLSPFVVLVSLSVWTTLWGLPGAILAIPLTSMFVIIFDSFPGTRPIAVLLSENPSVAPSKTAKAARKA